MSAAPWRHLALAQRSQDDRWKPVPPRQRHGTVVALCRDIALLTRIHRAFLSFFRNVDPRNASVAALRSALSRHASAMAPARRQMQKGLIVRF